MKGELTGSAEDALFAARRTRRPHRHLTITDLMHYQRIVVALKETVQLMEEIDPAIPETAID
jgi:hypothetical protein